MRHDEDAGELRKERCDHRFAGVPASLGGRADHVAARQSGLPFSLYRVEIRTMSYRDSDQFEHDAEFQGLLVYYLEALARGETVDREQLQRDQPRYADSIVEFLENRAYLCDALAALQDPSQFSQPITTSLNETRVDDQDSTWSLGRMRGAQFPVEFGEYSLLSEIGRGGMGIVFKAEHRRLNRIVGLKVMREGELSSEEELARFRAEAETSAAINHPNIISIFEVGEAHGLTYFTMAHVDGENLSAMARRRCLSFKEAARIIARMANAVHAAHQCGIIHRDIKPSNILVDSGGEPFLIDFGLAKGSRSNRGLTCTGQILGTPAYMSPEQARGEKLSAASDIYSLGAVLYELATGQPPFSGPTPVDILLQVLNLEPPTPRKVNPHVPRALDTIISSAMAKAPAERYDSARSLEGDLRRFILDEPIETTRPTLLERANIWWRREPVLVSHLSGILAALLIVLVSLAFRNHLASNATWVLSLLTMWALGSCLLQRVSVVDRYQTAAFWGWAAFDVLIYTTLIYIAETPRALLLVGYPMMIAASGLYYRARFVVFVTTLCIAGFLLLLATVPESLAEKPEYCIIYISGLIVLALCLIAMIRRVRGLADYFASTQ